jgi:hypothetical protein
MSETETQTGEVLARYTYAKKITAGLGFLRPMTEFRDDDGKVLRPASDPVPLMRVGGEVTEAYEETSEYGNYLRFLGRFRADVVQRDGTVRSYSSVNLILPKTGEEWLQMQMKSEAKVTDKMPKNRTGIHFVPNVVDDDGFHAVAFVADIWLHAPRGEKASTKGYEFDWRIVRSDPRFNVLASLIPEDTAPLLPAPTPPTLEVGQSPAPASAPETKGRNRQAA